MAEAPHPIQIRINFDHERLAAALAAIKDATAGLEKAAENAKRTMKILQDEIAKVKVD